MRRRALYIGLSILVVLVVLIAGLFGALQTDMARERLRLWIADATAGTATQVQIETIEGAVPFDMQIIGIRVSDRDGPWLSADRIALSWSPGALLRKRLQIDSLAAGTIDMQRLPAAEQTPETTPPGPLLPELPLAIDLRALSVDNLALAAPILGEPAALAVRASARLGEIADGLAASLSLRQRTGHTGTAQIDLAYQPDRDFLTVKGDVQEPQGGVLGRLLGLPQQSDLRLALNGEGPLADWRGHMNATLDGKPLVDLTADIQGGREARTVGFALKATPDVLLPEQVRPLAEGGIEVRGRLTIVRDVRTIGVSDLSAKSAAGALTASGVLGLNEPGELAITLTTGNSQPFAVLVPDVAWSATDIRARLQGTIDAPRVTADATVQNLAAAGYQAEVSKLVLTASAERGLEQPVALQADLQLSDLATPDPRLTALLAEGVRLTMAGSADQTGTLTADKLDLRSGALALAGSGRTEKWGAAARQADATLTIADLAVIGTAMDVPAKGAAEIALKLAPAASGERLELNGSANALSLGQPMLDRVLGPTPHLHLVVEGTMPQSITIAGAQLDGAMARLGAKGTIADQTLDLAFTASADDVAAIDPTVQGKAAVDGTISGTLDAPTVAATLTSPALAIAGRNIQDLKLNTRASDLLTKPQIALDGTASFDRLPAKLTTSVAVDGERIAAQKLDLTLGRSRVTGDVAAVKNLLTGKLKLESPDLAEIGHLAGTDLRGALSASVEVDAAKGQQDARVSATGQSVAAADALEASRLDLTASADDLFGAPSIAADLKLDQPVIADHPLRRARLVANGPLSGLRTRLALAGPDLNATAEAEIAQIANGYRIRLQSLAATVKDIHVKSTSPATIEIGEQATRIENVALAVEDGTLRVDGTVAPDKMEMTANVKSLPVSLARAFAPDFPVAGRLDGDLQLSGTPSAPSGRFTIAGHGIGPVDAAEQQADLEVDGTLQQGRLDISGNVKPKAGGALTYTAALPSLQPDARMEAKAQGTLDLALLDAFLAGGADRVKGKAEIDMTATGAIGAPQVVGTLRLVDASYENLRYGIKLRKIAAELRADGPMIQLASLTAATPGGGRVTGSGTIDLTAGIATDLVIQARNATVIDTELASAIVDSDLAITGNLKSKLTLGGKVTVVKADIRVPDKLPPSVQEIAVKEVNAPPRVAARLAAQEPAPRQTLLVALDLGVDAPKQVAVRGRGLDVELGGALKITGTTAQPVIDGALKLRRGSLDIVGKRLDFTEGQLAFEGTEQIDPILDLTAVARAEDLQVTAKVEGSARAPRISLSSAPQMPEDEILARLLFGKSAGALSPFELLQLAQATADLAGVRSGPGLLDRIRQSTGLDRLSLEQSEGAAGPSLSAGRYVSEGVYVGVSQGAQAKTGAATVEIEVTPNVKVESEIGANADGKAGVNLEWDY